MGAERYIFACGWVLESDERGDLARNEGRAERLKCSAAGTEGKAAAPERYKPNLCETMALLFLARGKQSFGHLMKRLKVSIILLCLLLS